MKKRIGTVALVFFAFILSACGAQVNTLMKVNPDGSGSRNITVQVSKSNFTQYVTGGVSEIQAIIDADMPKQMSASKITEANDKYVVTFTIAFDSIKQYEEKIKAILDAGGDDTAYTSDVVLADSAFRSGLSIDENFSSKDLLNWFEKGIEKAGLVEDLDSVLETGDTVVDFAGHQQDLYSGAITYNSTASEGLTKISVSTVDQGDGTWTRSIFLEMPTASYVLKKDDIDAYLEDQEAEVTDALTDNPNAVAWKAVISGTAEQISSATDQLLSDPDAVFSVGEAGVKPGTIVPYMEVTDQFTCAAICSQDVNQSRLIALPDNWGTTNSTLQAVGDIDSFAEYNPWFTGAAELVQEDLNLYQYSSNLNGDDLAAYPTITGLSFTTAFEFGGAMAENIKLNLTGISAEDAEAITESLADPDKGITASSNAQGDTGYTVTMRISADDAEQFAAVMMSRFPDSSITIEDQSSFFSDRTQVSMLLDVGDLFDGTPVDVNTTVSFATPFMHSVSTPEAPAYQMGGDYVVAIGGQYSGMSLWSLIIVGVLLLIIIIAIIILIIFREQVKTSMNNRKAKNLAKAAAAQAQFAAQMQTQVPGTQMPGAGQAAGAEPISTQPPTQPPMQPPGEPPTQPPGEPPLSESDLI